MTELESLAASGFVQLTARSRQIHSMIRSAFGLLLGAALLVAFLTVGGTSALGQLPGPVPLTLINGWTNAPFGTSDAAVETVNGIVHFKGAIATSGTNPEPFVLPKRFRPLTAVFVPVDLCNATNGRLDIQPNGAVTVEAEGGMFGNAQCFTSLDGASFVQ
jgi:hypothetical protein